MMYRFLSLLLICWCAAWGQVPRVYQLDGKFLAEHRGSAELGAAARSDADKVMGRGPYSVTQKGRIPPSGDKHDYMSQAPYFWPDPAKPDGKPYIRKDGEHNPEIDQIPDHGNMGRVATDSRALALAWYFTGDEKYAARAALVLRTWFLDAGTRMNPNLNFGQGIPGINDGRGIGIIESRGLTSVVDAVGLLAGSKNWRDADQKGMEQWFAAYWKWLRESKNGRDEAKSENNHGTYYDVQLIDFALFAGEIGEAKKVLEESRKKRIAAQIEPDGRQPKETARTRGMSYSIMNLSGLMELARLGEQNGVDFWRYETSDGRGIRKALDWMIPFVTGEKKWPYEQILQFNKAELVPCLLRGAAAYEEPTYAALAQRLSSGTPDLQTRLLRAAVKP